MIYVADLHTHSTASDGQYTPAELVRLAKERGLEVLALTDHDTVDGVAEAVETGKNLGLRVLSGVELGAKEHKNLHILGYQFDPADPNLTELCRKLRDGRDERKYRIIDFLHEKGVDIPLDEVEELAGGGSIGRPHFAQVMVRHGYVSTTREAFDRYLDTDEYQRIERFKADARTCVEAIRAAGGKVSLAHPYQLGLSNEQLEELVQKLTDRGLDGLECRYPRHTPEQTAFYLKLAQKYGLHPTGGSDFHGEKVKPDISLAAWELELDWLI
jgi:hypothetical protein